VGCRRTPRAGGSRWAVDAGSAYAGLLRDLAAGGDGGIEMPGFGGCPRTNRRASAFVRMAAVRPNRSVRNTMRKILFFALAIALFALAASTF
jgi:hypothetical protein